MKMIGASESSSGKTPLSVTRTVTIGPPAPLEPSGVEGAPRRRARPRRGVISSLIKPGSQVGVLRRYVERERRPIGTRHSPIVPAPAPRSPRFHHVSLLAQVSYRKECKRRYGLKFQAMAFQRAPQV